ncbi:MAG: AI-2E family transporter [Beijerinckiaceae bacterium]
MPMVSDTVRNLAASLVVMALIIAALVVGKDIFIPLALSAVLAFILAPVVNWLMNRRVPHGAAVGGLMLAVVITLSAAAIGFSAQILSVTTTLNDNKQNLVMKLRNFTGKDASEGILGRASRSISALEKAITSELETEEKKSGAAPTVVVQQKPESGGSTSFMEIAKGAVGPLATFLVTMLFTAFLLLQNHDLRDRIVRVLGTDNMSGTTAALSEAGDRLGQLFLGQAMINAGFGLFIAIALWVIGVPNPLLWGVAAGLLRFVPYIGAFLSSLPPLLLAAAVDPTWTTFIATAAVFLISEPIMGHVIDPLVLGKRVGLSPFAMVAAASFWTLVWGPVGLLLAAPLTMVLVVIGENIPQLNYLSVLLGDKPALDPNTQFYHRLLSNDSASAVEQIEEELETGSIKTASDQIVLPALRLAALDQRRGRISADQLKELHETMDDVTDAIPGTSATLLTPEAKAVMDMANPNRFDAIIVPARGSIDTMAGEYVAAALAKAGLGKCLALTEASGMMAMAAVRTEMEQGHIGAIVLSTVGGMDGRHLRFLAKRAAREFPGTPIMLCDWGQPRDMANSLRVNDDLGAGISECSTVGELISLLQLQLKFTPPGTETPTQLLDRLQPASA